MSNEYEKTIFSIDTPADFEAACIETFQFQAKHCAVYKAYLAARNSVPDRIKTIRDIPFLPIEFFKTQQIISENRQPEIIFSSSGTTGVNSYHYVADLSYYEQSFMKGFERNYGNPENLVILALLPNYSEREGSSLIYMTDALIQRSKQAQSGYFLYDHQALFDTLRQARDQGLPTLLLGVTYALLDFAATYPIDFPELIVMETGGMKGKRKEMVRPEVHARLQQGFQVPAIHSEYGMTELLSQAYSKENGIFECPPWMQVWTRDTNDPLSYLPDEQTGAINVIDLANRYSCAFIATQDLGKRYATQQFEVLGRFDNSDIRGCNLLVQ